jgi:lipopolysaccharide transport system permease protein
MIVFTIIFGKLAKLPSEGVPYPILVFAAMLPWQFFSNSLSESSNSLIANANLLSKIYFPRIIMPTSSVIVGLVDFLISFVILALLMIWYKFIPDWRLLYSINPMVGVIDGFRWALLGQNIQLYWPGFLLSIGLTFLVFLYGLRYFRMTERTFADVI